MAVAAVVNVISPMPLPFNDIGGGGCTHRGDSGGGDGLVTPAAAAAVVAVAVTTGDATIANAATGKQYGVNVNAAAVLPSGTCHCSGGARARAVVTPAGNVHCVARCRPSLTLLV